MRKDLRALQMFADLSRRLNADYKLVVMLVFRMSLFSGGAKLSTRECNLTPLQKGKKVAGSIT